MFILKIFALNNLGVKTIWSTLKGTKFLTMKEKPIIYNTCMCELNIKKRQKLC